MMDHPRCIMAIEWDRTYKSFNGSKQDTSYWMTLMASASAKRDRGQLDILY